MKGFWDACWHQLPQLAAGALFTNSIWIICCIMHPICCICVMGGTEGFEDYLVSSINASINVSMLAGTSQSMVVNSSQHHAKHVQ